MNEPTPDRAGSSRRRADGQAAQGGGSRPSGRGTGRPASGSAGGRSGAGSRSSKPYGKSAETRGEKKPYGRSAESSGEKKPYGRGADARPDRPYGKSAESRGEKKPYGRGADARPDRPYGKSAESRGEKKPYGRSADTRPDRPYGKSAESRGEKKPYGRSADARPDRPYGKSAESRGEKKPYGRSADTRPDRGFAQDTRGGKRAYGAQGGDARGRSSGRRDERPPREAPRPGLAAKANEPETPKGLDLRQLPRGVRAELRGLTAELAEVVGAHLLMAGQLIDTDPELAYAHAEAARRRAARLPITREAAAETAYAAGDFSTALTEFRALRRMSGGNEYLPAMADCERALGRHQAALKLIKEGLASEPEAPAQIELRLVEAGIRADTGHVDEALRLLRNEIESIGTRGTKMARARLRYAYADLLERTGDGDQAERWFDAVVRLDPDQETDAADRAAALRGLVIVYDDEDEDGGSDAATGDSGETATE